jgi:hypothetical protein
MTPLARWEAALAALATTCPWPGARSLTTEDENGLLVGRDREVRDFTRLVFNTDVVVLTGRTGVGKTSLLQRGLKPSLRKRGFQVISCSFSQLAQVHDTDNAEDVIADMAAAQLPAGIVLGQDQPPLERQLDARYPNAAVILLDQFEELIRYQPRIYASMLEWISKTAATTRIRIVISLRIEFEHQLGGHGGLRLGPFQQARLELAPVVDAEDIRKVIAGDEAKGRAITSDATARLAEHWAATGVKDRPVDVGLLHLQAALYVLWSRANGSQIDVDDVMALENDAAARATTHDREGWALTFFQYALAEYVGVRLAECRMASETAALPDLLIARTQDLVVALSHHLSSGGYKVPASVTALSRLVLFPGSAGAILEQSLTDHVDGVRRLRQLFDDPQTHELSWLDAPSDLLSVRRSALLDRSEPPTGNPWELDEYDVTAGPLLGLSPLDAALEELRAFYFALHWLRTCALVSIVSTASDKTMVQLVHDGFDAGLEDWRSGIEASAGSAIQRVTALNGERLELGALTDEVLVNLRWRSCDVPDAVFRGVTFINCDLRGTRFRRCTFEGVALVNCVLDEVLFTDCTILGEPSAAPTQLTEEQIRASEPPFVVADAPHDLVRMIAAYRELPEPPKDARLYSDTAGFPALPATGAEDGRIVPFRDGDGQVAGQAGGLVMFGGRLSSFKVRSCSFEAGGRLALRHVAGSQVELSEQTHVVMDVFAAAIRGLTVTRPVGTVDEPPQRETRTFEINVDEAHLINVWFGVDLTGRAVIANSLVWQLLNAAQDFPILMPNTKAVGTPYLADGSLPEADRRRPVEYETPPSPTTLGNLARQVRSASEKIDYRRYPGLSADSAADE